MEFKQGRQRGRAGGGGLEHYYNSSCTWCCVCGCAGGGGVLQTRWGGSIWNTTTASFPTVLSSIAVIRGSQDRGGGGRGGGGGGRAAEPMAQRVDARRCSAPPMTRLCGRAPPPSLPPSMYSDWIQFVLLERAERRSRKKERKRERERESERGGVENLRTFRRSVMADAEWSEPQPHAPTLRGGGVFSSGFCDSPLCCEGCTRWGLRREASAEHGRSGRLFRWCEPLPFCFEQHGPPTESPHRRGQLGRDPRIHRSREERCALQRGKKRGGNRVVDVESRVNILPNQPAF